MSDSPRPHPASPISVAAAQAIGRRERQEDAFHAAVAPGVRGALLVVADGMGGMAGGDAASRAAVDASAGFLDGQLGALPLEPDELAASPDPAADDTAQTVKLPETEQAERDEAAAALLRQAVGRAQRAVVELARAAAGKAAPGSTLAVALILETSAHIASVGDTRAYLLQGGALRQVSYDHSGASALVAAGLLAPAEARAHPAASQLYRFLGDRDALAAPDLHHVALGPGDRLLLCSDGLWGVVDDAEIAALLAGPGTADGMARALVAAAEEAGGEDNITAALACIG